jgi:Mg2+ and Co2+ transporter CorA
MRPGRLQGRVAEGSSVSQPEPGGIRARLFDADNPDQRLDRARLFEHRPTERQLLWIDITGDASPEDVRRLAERFELRRSTRAALERTDRDPYVSLHRDYLHVRVAADPSDRNPADTPWLDVIAGPNVVVTEHQREIPFLADLDARIQRDAAAGILSSTAFFTAIVDAAITSYHAAVDAIEDDVDRLDADSLRAGQDRDDLLHDLVRCRRRIARLRRVLADHRGVFTALASPEIGRLLEDDDAASMLQGLSSRFDGAMGAVEDARDALLGSFDVYMSRTAQRTNEVMKALTLATVLLLPGSMIAGLLGMNVIVPLDKDNPMSFWLVIGSIIVLAVVILGVARARRWL